MRQVGIGSYFKIPLFWTPVVCDSSVSNPELCLLYMEWGTVLLGALGCDGTAAIYFGVVANPGQLLVDRSHKQSKLDYPIFLYGIASIEEESKTGQAFLAIAGLNGQHIALLVLPPPQVACIQSSQWPWQIWRINLRAALFNLIPGLPLDGGQVLKAVV